MLIQEGININPILHDTGVRIGEALFNKIYDPDLDIFIENLADFWKSKGLGKLSVDLGQIIKITTVDCFECALLPKVGQPVCFLDAGIFEALFGAYFKLPVNVIEVKCYTMGDEQCTFEIEPVSIKKS